MREIELDAFYDPKGGLFANSAALRLAGVNGTLPDPRYYQPGSKVCFPLHPLDRENVNSLFRIVTLVYSLLDENT